MWHLSIAYTYGERAIWVISSQHDLPTPTHLTIITQYRFASTPASAHIFLSCYRYEDVPVTKYITLPLTLM